MSHIKSLLVSDTLNLRGALKRMDQGRAGILLLVDAEGSLCRTITDGDIRRLLVAGVSPEDTLARLPAKKPVTAPAGTSKVKLAEIMRAHRINQIPLVDNEGVPQDLIQLYDIQPHVLLSTPHMGNMELDFIGEAFDTNWIAPLGPNVDAFERELADKVGIAHAAAVSSGTAAIHLALVLLGVGRGDHVFCSSLTFVASANPILYQGAVPVFIDSEPASWSMSPQALKKALDEFDKQGRLPKAVIVVNLYGQSADMDPILELCNRYEVPVVEDAAESLGAEYKGRASGTFGRMGIYSFNGNKIITTSGGGMLVSSDGELIDRARFLATQARESAPYYLHASVGFNYRMSNVLAGIGRGQLRVLDERVAARRHVFERYVEGLAGVEAIDWMPELSCGRSNRWLSCCLLRPGDSSMGVPQLIDLLAAERIEARHVWRPMHRQPLFDGCEYYAHGDEESVADSLFQNGLCLPSGSNMSEDHQARVIDAIRGFLVGGS